MPLYLPRRRGQLAAALKPAGALAVCVCALAVHGRATADEPAPERLAQVRQICADTMRLQPMEAPFEACVGSLLKTLADGDAARRETQACAERGLAPGSPNFALCAAGDEPTPRAVAAPAPALP